MLKTVISVLLNIQCSALDDLESFDQHSNITLRLVACAISKFNFYLSIFFKLNIQKSIDNSITIASYVFWFLVVGNFLILIKNLYIRFFGMFSIISNIWQILKNIHDEIIQSAIIKMCTLKTIVLHTDKWPKYMNVSNNVKVFNNMNDIE